MYESLKLPKKLPFPREVIDKRLLMIENSISLETGTKENPIEHNILNFLDYSLNIMKPGKEAFEDKEEELNLYDAPPVVRFKGEKLNFDPSFKFITDSIYKKKSELPNNINMEIFAALLIRNAYLLDHFIENDMVVYKTPKIASSIQHDFIKDKDGIPIPPLIFINYIDLIATNEDVKYYKKKEKEKNAKKTPKQYIQDGTGRFNCLLTLVHALAIYSNKVEPYELVNKFLRTGVQKLHTKNYQKFDFT